MPKEPASNDSSIFHGKKEISRSEFRDALRKNYQGSEMNVSDRIKIEKKDFPLFHGSNISKGDLKTAVHKLSQKMSGVKDPAEHAKIRKEISYLKKIGKI